MNAEDDIRAEHDQTERWNDRTIRLLGEEAYGRLAEASVLVVGLGGVGGYAAEMLARSGVGNLTLIDSDQVAPSNINRQLVATIETVGQSKAILFADRFHSINPLARIDALKFYLSPDNVESVLDHGFDFVLDCIDTVAPKVALIDCCLRRRVPIISSMGAGGRTDPSKVEYRDLWQTREDGLARAVRQRLKKIGQRRNLPTVCSTEPPHRNAVIELTDKNKRSSYGTLATIPALFGIYMASYCINKLTQ